MRRRVVITGAGTVNPLGTAPASTHAALCEGRSGLGPVTLFPAAGIDGPVVGEVRDFRPEDFLGPANLRPLDRTARLLASAAAQALAHAALDPAVVAEEVGLVVGTMFCSAHTIGEFDRRGLVEGPSYVSPLAFASTVLNAAAGQTAIQLGLRGVNSTIATGASSGLQALAYAADLIAAGRASAVLAGGVDELCYETYLGFLRARLVCNGRDLPVPFHSRGAGFAPAEGAAVLLLEEASSARARGAQVLAEVAGHGSALDPTGGADPQSTVAAQLRSIGRALQEAGRDPESVDAVSASANGSACGDRAEALALAAVFGARRQPPALAAIKAMLGEALGGSGPVQVVELVETFRDSRFPGLQAAADAHGFVNAAASPSCRSLDVRCGLVNSAGADGHCCSLVLTRCDR